MIRSRNVVFVGLSWAAAAAIAACGGKALTLGASNVTQAIDPALVAQPTGACQSGYAHPNVCCQEASNGTARCEGYPDAPFLACPAGYDTLPDPNSCCPLDPSTGGCVAQDAGTSAPAQDAGSSQCTYACPLGWYPPLGVTISNTAAATLPGCCSNDSNGNATCAYPSNECPAAPQAVCACPAILVSDDGATTGPACNCGPPTSSSCTLPAAPPEPVCDPCPTGWQAPSDAPGLCCQTDPSGDRECFSQAVPPAPPSPHPADAGSSPPAADATPPPAQDASTPPEEDAAPPPKDAMSPDQEAGGECVTPSDCKGALPALCQICSDGGNGCAHFTCVDNLCAISYCD